MHAARSVADAIEKSNPGSVHKLEFTFSNRRLQANITYNRDRGGTDGAEQNGAADNAASAPADRRSEQASGKAPSQARPTAQQTAGQSRPNQGRNRTSRPEVHVYVGPQETLATMADVARCERAIKVHITLIVRSLGGNERTGGQYLCSKVQFCIGTHKVSLRVPLGSSASQLDADQLKSQFKTLLARFVEDQPTCETAIREWLNPTSMDVSAAPAPTTDLL